MQNAAFVFPDDENVARGDPSEVVAVNVDAVMRDIEDEVRRARRKRLLAHGAASEYGDERIYASVDGILRRAIEARDHDALLLPELVGGEDSSRLTTHLRFSSHRSLLGPAMIFAKRRVLLPAMRWLYEYSLNNFRRQDRLNRVLFACIEELAIENAKLRLTIAELRVPETGGAEEIGGLRDREIAEKQDGRIAETQDGGIAESQEGRIAGGKDGRIAGQADAPPTDK